jgi:hypothetical protein
MSSMRPALRVLATGTPKPHKQSQRTAAKDAENRSEPQQTAANRSKPQQTAATRRKKSRNAFRATKALKPAPAFHAKGRSAIATPRHTQSASASTSITLKPVFEAGTP